MTRNQFLSFVFGFFMIASSACKPGGGEVTPTLADLIKGKIFVLGASSTITKEGSSTDIKSDFSGFKIEFNSAGTSVTITAGGSNTTPFSGSYTINNNIIQLNNEPTNWGAQLTQVTTNTDGTTLTFKVFIENNKTGDATHTFTNLVKQ